ncbi:hypothetical protein BJ912DRAFT_610663 [Pholiota molesta]|nr:hypothetical protein BJ912DRAFT_610663 [Pholiota molesta]
MASVLNFVLQVPLALGYFKAGRVCQCPGSPPRPACEMGWCTYDTAHGQRRFASSRCGRRLEGLRTRRLRIPDILDLTYLHRPVHRGYIYSIRRRRSAGRRREEGCV